MEELIHCPWCLAHYITLFLLLLVDCRTQFIATIPIFETFLNFIITWFAIISISGLFHAVILIAYKPVKESEMIRQAKKKKLQ